MEDTAGQATTAHRRRERPDEQRSRARDAQNLLTRIIHES